MIYEFEDTQTGERVEIDFPASQAPPLDVVIKQGGRSLKRVLSLPSVGVMGAKPFKPHAADSLDRWLPDAPRHDAEGRPVFLTRAERDDTIKKTNDRLHKMGTKERIEIRE